MGTSIIFEFKTVFILKLLLLLVLLFLSGIVFPQADSSYRSAAPDDSLLSSDTPAISMNKIPNEKFSLKYSKSFFQYWSDQFPSPIIMHFNGLPVSIPQDLPIKKENDDWKFWLSLALLAMLAWIRFGYMKDFQEQMDVFRNWGMNLQMIREIGLGIPFGVVLLNIFSAIVISFYSFLLVEHFEIVHIEPSWILMIGTFILASAILFVRYLLLKGAELISTHGKEIKLYIYYELQINRVIGIFLFPFTLLIAFGTASINHYVFYASLVLLASLIVIRLVKGFNLGISYFGNHVIHFLIYICALEISPILIVIRIVSNINPLRFSFLS